MATESELHAQSVLEEEGFKVETIPRRNTRTADFLVTDAESTYLVEVMGKDESEFCRALLDRATEEGVADGTRGLSDRPLGIGIETGGN